MPQQIALRLPDDLITAIEALVSHGRYPTRAAVIRTALSALIEAERRRTIDEAIANGYRRMPESDDELTIARAAAERLASDPNLPW